MRLLREEWIDSGSLCARPYNPPMSVRIETDVSLRPYNTFGVEARAAHFARVTSIEELGEPG